MLAETSCSTPESAFGKFLDDQGDERDEEHDEDGHNTTLNPVKDRMQVSTSGRLERIGDWNVRIVVASNYFVAQSAKVDQADHK